MNGLRRAMGSWWVTIPVLTLITVALSSPSAALQDTTTRTVTRTGEPMVTTQVKSGEVVYVSGDDLVIRLESGELENFVVPDNIIFLVDGKYLTLGELKPGTRLTQTITSTSTPHLVRTVRTITGTVWHVNPPNVVVLRLPDHTNKTYRVPEGQQFNIDGEIRDVFHLKTGMKITATVVTETPETVEATAQTMTGEAPPPTLPAPSLVGVLLIELPPTHNPLQQTAEAQDPTLPNTASDLPWIVLLGALAIAGWVVLRSRHSKHGS